MDFRGTKNLGILICENENLCILIHHIICDAQTEVQTLSVYRWQWGDVVLIVSGTFSNPVGKET